ncbi:ribosomal protein L13, eukaryotic/archaeal [Kipferlia bialata]|uniref:Ribosomal protein L13, eukaryotic/archaeal n=1 Tax=Kipferlia bialata TaxID=797122 RepID=A0A391NQL7_9EUKA|nr:ribosomal protein L13, eukaryotic/archaeal [Kipferlia bialata]|eukprot:g11579.t1
MSVVIDCSGHLVGRLASVCAKDLMEGKHITLVRCEEANISGAFIRNKLKYMRFLHKSTNTNHTKGPFHHRCPSAIVHRTIRGMIPHKTARGMAAMSRLQTFDGCPPPFDRTKRMVVPEALRVMRLKPTRKFTVLKRVSEECGWKYGATVARLEGKRKAISAEYYQNKKVANKAARAAVTANKEVAAIDAELAKFGF